MPDIIEKMLLQLHHTMSSFYEAPFTDCNKIYLEPWFKKYGYEYGGKDGRELCERLGEIIREDTKGLVKMEKGATFLTNSTRDTDLFRSGGATYFCRFHRIDEQDYIDVVYKNRKLTDDELRSISNQSPLTQDEFTTDALKWFSENQLENNYFQNVEYQLVGCDKGTHYYIPEIDLKDVEREINRHFPKKHSMVSEKRLRATKGYGKVVMFTASIQENPNGSTN